MVETVLKRINKDTDQYLRERREILKRVVEFDSFESCWQNDRMEAKGLVQEIRDIVNKKDSFTRMKQEKKRQRHKQMEKKEKELQKKRDRRNRIDNLKNELSSLVTEDNPHKRGKKFEGILNAGFNYQVQL